MALLALALIIDWRVGDPDWLWRRIRHPVVLFGAVIDWFDKHCLGRPRDSDYRKGACGSTGSTLVWWGLALVLALFALVVAVSVSVRGVSAVAWPLGVVIELAIVVTFLAQKSLHDHVQAVADALRQDGIEGGRKAVAMIVGRDVSKLDESGVLKAAIESLAENFSDGVTAPVFWYAVGGLPGLMFYKAINTADSMIGHRSETYEHFGKPAAVLDDLMNWIPARLSVFLIIAATTIRAGSKQASLVWHVTLHDAPKHRSPNAGWPEVAFAAALDLRLGGARSYGDDLVDGAVLNAAGRNEATTGDIGRALDLFRDVCFVLIAAVLFLAVIAALV